MQQINDALYHLYSDGPLEDCLNECIAVGVALRADELIGWARRELTGYPKNVDVPDYRFAKIQLIGVEHSGGTVITGPVALDEFDISNWEIVTTNKNAVRWSIGDIAGAIAKADENHESYIIVSLLASADQLLKQGHRSYTQVYWGVLRDSLDGILQAVRNTGITMLKALSRNGEPEGSKPGRQDTAQALGVVVAGKRHRINVRTNQSSAGNAGVDGDENPARRSRDWAGWQVYIAAIGLLVTVAGVVPAYLALRSGPTRPAGASSTSTAQYVVTPEACAVSFDVEGFPGPTLCPDGRPSRAVDHWFRQRHLKVFSLGPDASPSDVISAICSDLASNPTVRGLPYESLFVEGEAVKLWEAEEKWQSALVPAGDIAAIQQTCPSTTSATG